MKFLLDTNVYFAAIHEAGFLDAYGDLLLRIAPRTFLSSVVRFELLQGARGDLGRGRVNGATRQLERTGRLVTPSHGDWERAGRIQGAIWDENPRLRTKSLENDILIASSARRIGATVVSENLDDFGTIGRYLPHRVFSVAALAAAFTGAPSTMSAADARTVVMVRDASYAEDAGSKSTTASVEALGRTLADLSRDIAASLGPLPHSGTQAPAERQAKTRSNSPPRRP